MKGTGLGMPTAKGITDAMGGEITMESEIERGSRFDVILTFPTISQEEYAHNTSEEEKILRGMRFMRAEDNELNAEILEATLEIHGAQCDIYPDGKKLVDAFIGVTEGECDAILMDIQMPNTNGLEAAKAIRLGDNPYGSVISIIAMSANAFTSDAQRSIKAGINAHLVKPIDIRQLEKTMESLLFERNMLPEQQK